MPKSTPAFTCLPQPITGTIRPYDRDSVLRHLPSDASPIAVSGELFELYEKGERFWLIDDRWGLAEMNLLKAQWRSWIIDQPALEPQQVLEQAVLA